MKIISLWGVSAATGLAAPLEDQVRLEARHSLDEASQVNILLEVGGEFRMAEAGVIKQLKMSVVGKHRYHERILVPPRLVASGQSARLYEQAEASIKIEQGGFKPALRADRLQIGAQVHDHQAHLFSPLGPLQREELDLLEVPGSSLLVDGLLPGEPVRVGSDWTHDDDWLAAFLGLDAVGKNGTTSRLVELTTDWARCELAGHVSGAIHGVSTELDLQARFKFDRNWGRITWLALLADERRAIGHVGPGADVTSRLQMTIARADTPPLLVDESLALVEWSYSPGQGVLEYRSSSGRFQFLHDRRWHVMKDNPESVALRLIERGELLAQCNASMLPDVKPGERFSLSQFQEDMQRTLGKNFGQFLEASEGVNSRGQTVLRVVAAGQVSDLPIQWNYYLIADRDGHQLALAFTVESEQVPQLAESDAAIVESVEFSTATAQAAAPSGTAR